MCLSWSSTSTYTKFLVLDSISMRINNLLKEELDSYFEYLLLLPSYNLFLFLVTSGIVIIVIDYNVLGDSFNITIEDSYLCKITKIQVVAFFCLITFSF